MNLLEQLNEINSEIDISYLDKTYFLMFKKYIKKEIMILIINGEIKEDEIIYLSNYKSTKQKNTSRKNGAATSIMIQH